MLLQEHHNQQVWLGISSFVKKKQLKIKEEAVDDDNHGPPVPKRKMPMLSDNIRKSYTSTFSGPLRDRRMGSLPGVIHWNVGIDVLLMWGLLVSPTFDLCLNVYRNCFKFYSMNNYIIHVKSYCGSLLFRLFWTQWNL